MAQKLTIIEFACAHARKIVNYIGVILQSKVNRVGSADTRSLARYGGVFVVVFVSTAIFVPRLWCFLKLSKVARALINCSVDAIESKSLFSNMQVSLRTSLNSSFHIIINGNEFLVFLHASE